MTHSDEDLARLVLADQLAEAEARHDVQGQLHSLLDLAALVCRQQAAVEAYSLYAQAFALAVGQHDDASAITALLGCGRTLLSLHAYHDAVTLWKHAFALASLARQVDSLPECLSALSYAYLQIGETYLALAFGQQALGMLRERGDHQRCARQLKHLAVAYTQLEQFLVAADLYREGCSESRLADDQELLAHHLEGLGLLYTTQLEQPGKGSAHFYQALHLYKSLHDGQSEIRTWCHLGTSALLQHRWHQALVLFKKAQSMGESLRDEKLLVRTIVSLIGIYQHLERRREAPLYYRLQHSVVDPDEEGLDGQDALEQARSCGNQEAEGRANLHLASMRHARGDEVEALFYNNQAHDCFALLGDQDQVGRCLLNEGTALYCLRQPVRGKRARILALWRAGLALAYGEYVLDIEHAMLAFDVVWKRWGKRCFCAAWEASEEDFQHLLSVYRRDE